MMRLLGLLLAVPALAANLRGATEPRNLQVQFLEANQIAFIVNYVMYLSNESGRSATQGEYETFKDAVHGWVTSDVIDNVMAGVQDYAIDPAYGDRGCEALLFEALHVPRNGLHKVTILYTCKFLGVIAPAPVAFTQGLRSQSLQTSTATNLQATIEGSGASIFSDLTSVTTNQENNVNWEARGSSNRDNFDNDYFLPCILTWSFKTPRKLLNETDIEATKDATKEWVTNYWDDTYAKIPGARFARRTVEVTVRSTSFSPEGQYYRQGVTLGIDILVGANNITHVPSAREYTTTLQMVGRVSNFTDILEDNVDADSVLLQSNRTGFALTNTFDVMTLNASRTIGEPPVSDDLLSASTFQILL